jgi:predicted acyl esterase
MVVDAEDAMVMVSVSEVRPDGNEVLIQNGVQRLGYRVDEAASDGLEVAHDYSRYRPIRAGRLQPVSVEIPSFNQVVRAGSQLRVTITTPGRNFAAWAFEQPGFGREVYYQVFRQPGRESAVRFTVLPGIDVPDSIGLPPCPSLRGQVCRPYQPRENTTVR